jgi:hypothetical protein
MFHSIQTKVIETNMKLCERGTTPGDDLMLKKLKNMIANHFLEIYETKKLSRPSSGVTYK